MAIELEITPEVTAKAAAFFDHIDGARKAGKDWWVEALHRMLTRQVRQDQLLMRAEAFIAGFEGDELQTGVDDLLADIRSSIKSEARL